MVMVEGVRSCADGRFKDSTPRGPSHSGRQEFAIRVIIQYIFSPMAVKISPDRLRVLDRQPGPSQAVVSWIVGDSVLGRRPI